ncbi:MAG: endonuclease III [Anaerolineae bacterium]
MRDDDIHAVMRILREAAKNWAPALVDGKGEGEWDPYQILIATILSLRTKDTLTEVVAPRLFELADNPFDMVRHSAEELEQVIYPVGFYRNKAKSILAISQQIIEQYNGRVPDDLDALLQLPGVGRKTANLVITAGYNLPGICVDIHVHRISNRWGYISTKTPEKTEFALRDKLPRDYWLEYNGLLVSMGQNLCTPTSPWCSKCPLTEFCDRVGVSRSR